MWRFFKKLLTVTGIFWFPSYILRKNNWKKKIKVFHFWFSNKNPSTIFENNHMKSKKTSPLFSKEISFPTWKFDSPFNYFFLDIIFSPYLYDVTFGDLNHIFIMRLYNTRLLLADWVDRTIKECFLLTLKISYIDFSRRCFEITL